MVSPEDISLSGAAALGTLGTVCAILLRSTHQNLKALDQMRRDAASTTERLRQELRDHDNTIFELQSMVADYRFAIAKLQSDNTIQRARIAELLNQCDWGEI